MKKIAFLFPGQGSQYVGMGQDLMENFAEAVEIFEMADQVCGIGIKRLCLEGPMEELTRTRYLQPAVTALNLSVMKILLNRGLEPSLCAGHSLGEYSALACAKVLTLEDTLRAVKVRGELMEREAEKHPGSMAAVMGIEPRVLEEIISAFGEKDTCIANYNSKEQLVISGPPASIQTLMGKVKERGGKAVPLKVSGAWHSGLMKAAVEDFKAFLDGLSFKAPERTVIFNVTGRPESDPSRIRELMVRQLVMPVRWFQGIEEALNMGVDTFLELGPKNVLTNLLKRMLPKEAPIRAMNVEDSKGVSEALGL